MDHLHIALSNIELVKTTVDIRVLQSAEPELTDMVSIRIIILVPQNLTVIT